MKSNNCFLYSKADIINLNDSILHGYAITDSSIVINTKGIKEYEDKHGVFLPSEGRFAGIFKLNDKIVIKSDIHGQELIYLYENGTDWAISSSFYLLATYASKKSKIDLYCPAALNFFMKNGSQIGEQLISHRTMVEQIRILPFNHEMHVNKLTGDFSIIKNDFEKLFNIGDLDYDSTIISMLSKGMSVLESLSEAGLPMYLSLSGGYDSRLVLGMLSRSLLGTENVYIRSDVNKAKDLEVVSQLCNHFDIGMNDITFPKKRRILSTSESLKYFLMSCGSTYLPVYPVRSDILSENHVLRLTGDSTGYSFFIGNAMFNGTMLKVAEDMDKFFENRKYGNLVRRDFEKTFEDIGVDIKSNIAPIAYYVAVRGRHHCGRNWYKSLGVETLFTPLMSKDFCSLGFNCYSMGSGFDKLFADLFSAIGPWATDIPLESAKGGLSSSLLKNSKFKGGVKTDKINYKIYGQFHVSSEEDVNQNDFPLNFEQNEKSFVDEFVRLYKDIKIYDDIFSNSDISRANNEILAANKLSHHYRTATHIFYVDTINKIISMSQ